MIGTNTNSPPAVLGVKSIAANDDEIKVFSPCNAAEFRMDICRYAPVGRFYICYYNPLLKEWYRLYDVPAQRHMIFEKAYISPKQCDALWSKIEAMNYMRDQTQDLVNRHANAGACIKTKRPHNHSNILPFPARP